MSASKENGLQVLVVDDSAMVRQVMQSILGMDRRINVKTAADPLIAWAKMQKERPDVVISDLEMPRMDGLTFIRKIMQEMPTPVVVCSGLAGRGTELALRALEEGAVEGARIRDRTEEVLHLLFASRERPLLRVDVPVARGEELAVRPEVLSAGFGG